MSRGGGRSRATRRSRYCFICFLGIATIACRTSPSAETTAPSGATLAIGVAQLSPTSPIAGLRQLAPLLALEGLARAGEDGRMQPSLAESWKPDATGRTVLITLKPGIRFQDGSALDSASAASILPDAFQSVMGPVFEDVVSVKSAGAAGVNVEFRYASPFLLEALEATIRKPGPTPIGTGAFKIAPNSTTELLANDAYYLGRPQIDRITVSNYPSVRAAWAELLRNRIDMLWEVGIDALDSMKNSSTVSLFTYTRHYQHVMIFNTRSGALRSREVRRALNYAVDRPALVRNALRDYGVPSLGPVPPRHWALSKEAPHFEFDPGRAAAVLGSVQSKARLQFTCLVSADSSAERIALEIKRQLAGLGVVMAVEEASRDELSRRAGQGEYEAAIIEAISGPTLLRPYLFWHTRGSLNWAHFGSSTTDAAFDRVRYAESEDAYRDAVAGLQRAFMDDPPAMFLAWSVGTRAVSKRFDVQAEEGRDVLSTARLWRPSTAQQQANRN